MGRRFALSGWLVAALFAGACVRQAPVLPGLPLPAADPVEFSRWITFYDHPLEIHFSTPPHLLAGAPLLLYATGDGGWRGNSRDNYRHMSRWGYPVAGFSALGYITHLGFVSGTTTPERLGRDYRRLIAFAKQVLALPEDTRTILVGFSRGSGLSVVAATEEDVRVELAGVLAVALIREEEYVRHYRVPRRQPRGDTPTRELVDFDNYGSLELLGSLPVAVIQSTNDGYLSAAEARELFGPDSELHRLYPIQAKNHSFKGARDALLDQMAASLSWICKEDRAAAAARGLQR